MKKIIKAVKSLSSQQTDKLRVLLKTGSSKSNTEEIISSLLSFSGIDLLLSHLHHDELKVLNTVYKETDGITFGEIEKREKIDTNRIEKISKNLSAKLLVSVLKNRQKLHNKLDKIYVIPEIGNYLNPLEDDTISDYFMGIKNKLEKKRLTSDGYIEIIDEITGAQKLLKYIYDCGGLISLSELKKIIPSKYIDSLLFKLKENNLVYVYHDLRYSFKTFILLEENTFYALSQPTDSSSDLIKVKNINNQYMFLLNIFYVYDTISTYGLFITKQKEFRKIDKVRLAKSVHKLYKTNGKEFRAEELFQLSIFILYLQKNIDLKGDSVIVSLKNIEDKLDDPVKLLLNIIDHLQKKSVDNSLFYPPFDIPSYKDVLSVIKYINRFREIPYLYLQTIRLLKPLSEIRNNDLINISKVRTNLLKRYKVVMRFLCITGIIEIQNGAVKLSDIGKGIAVKLLKTRSPKGQSNEEHEEDVKKIYINPDFTFIIPKREIPSEALFHLLTHTDIVKDDVILYARISKDSILRAYKRGMSKTKFLSSLKKYSKIEVPQNLEFMINEWANQTIRLNISNATLMNSSHPTFIDDISYGDLKSSIIERLTPNYAIIDRKYIDKIVKLAKKSDAVITLFNEME